MVFPTHIVSAGGLVLNDRGEVLLVKNPRKGWEFPGGIVEAGETLPQGLIREIREESGVEAQITGIVGIYSNTRRQKGYNGVKVIPTIVTADFICKYVSGRLTCSNESVEVAWHSKEDALRIIRPRLLYRFERMLRHNGFVCAGYTVEDGSRLNVYDELIFAANPAGGLERRCDK